MPIDIVIDIPADFKADAITHAKEMVWPDRAVEDKNPKNDKQTSTITILGATAAHATDLHRRDGQERRVRLSERHDAEPDRHQRLHLREEAA